MKIEAFLNDQPLGVAVVQGFGLLTASVVGLRRHPQRHMAGGSDDLLLPELRFRLGGVRQSEEGDSAFTVLEYPLTLGDSLVLSLRPESTQGSHEPVAIREVEVPAEAPALRVGVKGRQSLIMGQPGFGMISALLVWANRHPSRCERRHGGSLPQHQLQLQLAAQDHNALDLTLQQHWNSPVLSPVDVIEFEVLSGSELTPPSQVKEHWH